MARIERVVAPGFPRHVTQRGNRRQPVFFSDEDYSASDDGLVSASPMLSQVGDWRAFLHAKIPDEWLRRIRQHQRTGRPLGDLDFLKKLERRLHRPLLPQKPGPKSKPERTP